MHAMLSSVCQYSVMAGMGGRVGGSLDILQHSPAPPSSHHKWTPKVRESCHLFKCDSARKSYLKDYLMAASNLAELKGQLPEQVALRCCWPAFETRNTMRCGSIAVDIITLFLQTTLPQISFHLCEKCVFNYKVFKNIFNGQTESPYTVQHQILEIYKLVGDRSFHSSSLNYTCCMFVKYLWRCIENTHK